jgi:diacylglycerol kinase (ATP)
MISTKQDSVSDVPETLPVLLAPRACTDGNLLQRLAQIDLPIDLRECPDEATLREELLRLAERPVSRAFVGGGDGTLHHVLQLWAEADAPPAIGFLPCGTANDAVRGLQLPLDPVEALRTLLGDEVQVQRLDTMRCNDIHALNVVSIGAPAQVTRGTPQLLKQALGPLAYVAYGLPQLATPEAFDVTLEVDDTRWSGRAYAIYVGNLPYAGGGFAVCPDADPTDGLLEVTVVPEQPLPMVWSLAGDAVMGGELPDYGERVERYRGRRVHLHLPDDVPMGADGEALPGGPLTIDCLPRSLRVLVPTG